MLLIEGWVCPCFVSLFALLPLDCTARRSLPDTGPLILNFLATRTVAKTLLFSVNYQSVIFCYGCTKHTKTISWMFCLFSLNSDCQNFFSWDEVLLCCLKIWHLYVSSFSTYINSRLTLNSSSTLESFRENEQVSVKDTMWTRLCANGKHHYNIANIYWTCFIFQPHDLYKLNSDNNSVR